MQTECHTSEPYKKVLLLNASYEPLNICSFRRAIVLLIKNKAEMLEHTGKYITKNILLPTVVRLRYYVKIPCKEVPLTRQNLLHRDNHTCQYCGISTRQILTIDHLIPKSKGGTDDWTNIVIACNKCNTKKGDHTPEEAGMRLLKLPKRPSMRIIFEISKMPVIDTSWQKYLIAWKIKE